MRNSENKILILQDHLQAGGAARAAGRWAQLLKESGWQVQQVSGDQGCTGGYLLTGKPARGLGRVWEYFSDRAQRRKGEVGQQLEKILAKEKPDLIWFHNLAGGGKWGWSEEMVAIARGHAPALWTLHDMWGLADGSESYWQEDSAVEGGRWKGAGAALVESGRRKGTGKGKVEGGREQGAGVKELKCSRVEKMCGANGKYPVRLTAPSKWLADLTKKITGQECVFLPNPIDLKIYSPGDRIATRRRWGLPEEGLVVLAGADSLTDPRKGFDLLREAWGRLPPNRATLALFGRHGENRPGEHYLGNLISDEEMVAAYRAADLYVHPARMENAPCTIQESLACGTPVLAFSVGGIPEMIEPGKTGFLAPRVDAESLGEALDSALADPSRLRGMREECCKAAEVVWRPQSLLHQFEEVAKRWPGFGRPLSVAGG